jgi:hypothetical protein
VNRGRNTRWGRARGVSVLAVLAALALSAGALAAGTVAAGRFTASGQIHFRFRLSKGVCFLAPKNLTNFRAGRGKSGSGLCFSSLTTAPVHIRCANGAQISGFTVDFSLFDRLRLAGGRTLHLKVYTYGSDPKPVGYTEFDLTGTGSRVAGFVRATDQISNGSGPVQCDTGKLRFSAHAG